LREGEASWESYKKELQDRAERKSFKTELQDRASRKSFKTELKGRGAVRELANKWARALAVGSRRQLRGKS
jgi:hypothetical protein